MPVGPESSHSHRAGPAPRVSRRPLLAAFPLLAVVAVAPACGTDPQSTEPDPRDIAAATGAIRTERDLLAAYDDAIARNQGLAGPLGAIRAHHAEHLQELEAAVPSPPAAPTAITTPPATGAATATSTATGSPGPAVQPGTTGSVAGLGELAHLERTAATAHRAGCLAATGPLAALLASLHAAETAHADLLGLLGGTAGR